MDNNALSSRSHGRWTAVAACKRYYISYVAGDALFNCGINPYAKLEMPRILPREKRTSLHRIQQQRQSWLNSCAISTEQHRARDRCKPSTACVIQHRSLFVMQTCPALMQIKRLEAQRPSTICRHDYAGLFLWKMDGVCHAGLCSDANIRGRAVEFGLP